ncbi:DUF6651 domain-containing protein [Pantoea coffeiphila]|uniref:DUF6651 domain-containing protein n=1 Tax=Pantoea coffeiphila TaxID=1465635 RepID=A0A2S9I859_9GAMM|nr:DUF6651 domain-containing protein [Pantoea coffeiphila]PRD13982.1 hypothetical protein CQW29_18425 [Pantoea coffeiphila]
MKLKLDADGHVVVENGMPVYVHDDGKEIAFDAAQAVSKISALNGEAKAHREAKEAAEANLAKFANISDPAKALEALDMMTKIDQKKLIDAGAIDQVRADITKSFQTQLDEANGKSQQLEQQLYGEMIGGRFVGSKFIQEKMAIPSDFVQARFGKSFKIEDGKIVAYDPTGNKIYSRSKPGDLADFDEALEFLVEQYPQKDHILKASGNSGSGSQQSQHQAGQKTMKRGEFDSLDPIARGTALQGGITIVD